MAWAGLIAYTLQIYYDFSGYSDMAIGMGLMFGFNFPENFNYPYISRSIREFWRRWHISLSTWFRDYLYIPLGGNRSSSLRVGLNLIIVFLLCGLWHGAAWNFVIWGLWHGLFLAIERTDAFKRLYRLTPLFFKHLYTLWIVMTGWILFRADSLSHAADYFTLCCFGGDFTNLYWPLQSVFSPYSSMILFAGIIGCMPWMKQLNRQIEQYKPARNAFARLTEQMLLMILFLFCLAELFASSYNPFIYFRF
jgi:alginate O-acetyltransferase complex protein AlgI